MSQHHDTLHNDDFGGMHIYDLLRTGTGDIGIDRHRYGLAPLQTVEVVNKQIPLNGIRVVEVDLLFLLRRLVAIVKIVSILRDDRH